MKEGSDKTYVVLYPCSKAERPSVTADVCIFQVNISPPGTQPPQVMSELAP